MNICEFIRAAAAATLDHTCTDDAVDLSLEKQEPFNHYILVHACSAGTLIYTSN